MEPMDRSDQMEQRAAEQPRSPQNERSSASFGATEEQMADRDTEIAPTFSDMEPGAGPNYGASGDPDTPDLGGVEDRTTLGTADVRPPRRDAATPEPDSARQVDALPREPRASEDHDTPSYGRSPRNGLGGAHPSERTTPPPPEADAGSAAHQQTPADDRPHAQADPAPADSPHDAAGAQSETGAGMLNQEHGERMGGVGPAGGAPGRGDTPDAVAARNAEQTVAPSAPGVSNTGVNKIDDKNAAYPDLSQTGAVTYGHPEAYAADGGLLRTSSGSAGELPGGHLNPVGEGASSDRVRDVGGRHPLQPDVAADAPETTPRQQ